MRVTNAHGSVDSATATTQVKPGITGQTHLASVALGGSVTLFVNAGGTAPLAHQWYRGARGVTTDPVPDATATTLTLTPPAGENLYWARVTNAVGGADSASVTVVGATQPVISAQPVTLSGRAGARFTASGGGLSYQWYRGEPGDTSGPVAGANGAMLLLPPMQTGGRFWVRASNVVGSADSAPVDLVASPVRGYALLGAGNNTYRQFGLVTTSTTQSTPLRLGLDVAAIAAGKDFSLFIKTDRSLWGMGYSSSGQLGAANPTVTTPTRIATDVVAVAAGEVHTLFLKGDGTLWGLGGNSYGQLGTGTGGGSTPVQVATGVARVFAGAYHSLFIKMDGTLWGMGMNTRGQLGTGNSAQVFSPVQIASGVVAAAAGGVHSVFLDAEGRAWSMGDNLYGQLGDSSTGSSRQLPVNVLNGVADLAAGAYHTYWIKTNATLWSAGANYAGQLGDGTTTQRPTPVQVASGATAAEADLSGSYFYGFGFFLKTDGTLWSMGYNGLGQLGLGSTTPSARPVPAQVAVGVAAVAAGAGHSLFLQLPPPRFTSVPAEVGVVSGQSATLTVSTESDGAVTYQWYLGASGVITQPMAGATSATFATPPASTNTTYWVRATNAYGSSDSPAINVIASTPPALTTPLAGTAVPYGQSASLRVDATGGALSYQWYRGPSGDTSRPVVGATGRELGLDAVTTDETYWVRVTNAAGSLDSAAVRVTLVDGARLLTMGNGLHGRLGLDLPVPPALAVASGVAAAAGGGSHSLWLKTDGTLWAVGANSVGQLGDGTTVDRLSPVQVATAVVACSAGSNHSLWLKADGTLWAAGANAYGQLGNGTTSNRATPTQVASGVIACAAGSSHSLWLKADGSLFAAGYNYSGQLGLGDTTDRSLPALAATGVAAIAAGGSHSLAIKTDGSLWSAGYNYSGQLGLGDTVNRTAFTRAVDSGVSAVSAGFSHTWLLKTDGSLWTSGRGVEGQLATGDTVGRHTFASVATGVSAIAACGNQGYYLRTDATLMAVGDNIQGQLGLGHSDTVLAPVPVLSPVRFAAGGAQHGLFVKTDGTLLAAGADDFGQLGDGSPDIRNVPTFALEGAIAVSSGNRHTVYLRADGSLWGFGDNRSGQLGAAARVCRTPVKIAENVTSCVAAGETTYFIRADRGLWGLGNGGSGQLGPAAASTTPVPVLLASDVRQVAASAYHTLFVKTDDSLWGMGANAYGQLVYGGPSTLTTPQRLAENVRACAAGGEISGMSAYIKTDGTLWTMGGNVYYQLGQGTSYTGNPFSRPPAQVAVSVARVVFGDTSLHYVRTDGTLWSAGYNLQGQLGVASPSVAPTPIQVATSVEQVSASSHLLVLKRDGSVWGSGLNRHGQLGLASTGGGIRGLAPILGRGGLAVSAGSEHSVILTVPAPVVQTPPSPRIARRGERVEFTVSATGAGLLDYQWRRNGAPLPLASGARTSRLVLESVDFADAGSYDVVVSLAGVETVSAPASLLVHDEAETSFPAWTQAHGLANEPLLDPDGGATAPALLRYAFKLPARGPTSSPTTASHVVQEGQRYLALSFPRKGYAPGLRYVVEAGSDLQSWTPIQEVLPGLPETVTVRDTQALAAGAPRFLRVRVELAP